MRQLEYYIILLVFIIILLAGCSGLGTKKDSPGPEYELILGGQNLKDLVSEVSHELTLYSKSLNPDPTSQKPVLLLAPLNGQSADAALAEEFIDELLPKLLSESCCRVVTSSPETATDALSWQDLGQETGSQYMLSFLFSHNDSAQSGYILAQLELTELRSGEIVWHKISYLHNHLNY